MLAFLKTLTGHGRHQEWFSRVLVSVNGIKLTMPDRFHMVRRSDTSIWSIFEKWEKLTTPENKHNPKISLFCILPPRSQDGFCGSETPQTQFSKAWNWANRMFGEIEICQENRNLAGSGGASGGGAAPPQESIPPHSYPQMRGLR